MILAELKYVIHLQVRNIPPDIKELLLKMQ